jgi:uncharacterized protein (DUF58 family)
MAFSKRLTIYAAAAATALVAWVLNVAQLYWMAGVLFILPLVCRLVGHLEHRGITVRRRMPYAAHQGETVRVRYQVENQQSYPKLQLSLSDELPPGLFPLSPDPVPVHLPPRGSDEGEYLLKLGRRGAHSIAGVQVRSVDLLGLSVVQSRLDLPSTILVYPRVIELPPSLLPPSRGGGHAPLDASQRQGEGSSFFGIREYRPGDPLRHVHWRTAARLGRLTVLQWEAEESTDAVIAVDTKAGSERLLRDGTTLDLAAGLAGSLAKHVLNLGDSLRLMAPGATQWRPSPSRGLDAMPGLLESLARMQATVETSVGAELRMAAPHMAPGTLICWLTPSPDPETIAEARYLRAAKLRPVIYALYDGTPQQAAAWAAAEQELGGVLIPTVRVQADDEIVRRLLG